MKSILGVLALVFLTACTSVPANSPMLNQYVTDGIERLKQQHFVTLDKMELQSINKINNDYDRIFSKAKVQFKKIRGVPPSSDADYMEVSIIVTATRDEIVNYIRDTIAQIKMKIGRNYDLVANINNEVTTYLYSASKLSTARSEVTKLINRITGVDFDLENMFVELDGEINQRIAASAQQTTEDTGHPQNEKSKQ